MVEETVGDGTERTTRAVVDIGNAESGCWAAMSAAMVSSVTVWTLL
jgi:hypothetical protein